MNRLRNIFQILFLIFGLLSCKEVYDDATIKSNKEVIVVQGKLTDQDGPYVVTVTTALPFNSKTVTTLNKIKRNDIVRIFDDQGHQETLIETGPGVYSTKETGIKGEPGRKYTLQIRTRDGGLFESKPCVMQASPEITDIYGEKSEVTYLIPESDGNYRSMTDQGLKVLIDLVADNSSNIFLRFESSIIRETVHSEQADPTVMPTYVRCWNSYKIRQSPNIRSSVIKENKNQIKKHTLCFLPIEKNPQPDDSISTPPILIGWITSTFVYTISEEVYNYYNQLNEQLQSTNSLFDPIPTQLTGNIRCLSDSTRLALGVFEVSSVQRKNVFFQGYLDGPKVLKREIGDVQEPEIADECTTSSPPDFWLDQK